MSELDELKELVKQEELVEIAKEESELRSEIIKLIKIALKRNRYVVSCDIHRFDMTPVAKCLNTLGCSLVKFDGDYYICLDKEPIYAKLYTEFNKNYKDKFSVNIASISLLASLCVLLLLSPLISGGFSLLGLLIALSPYSLCGLVIPFHVYDCGSLLKKKLFIQDAIYVLDFNK